MANKIELHSKNGTESRDPYKDRRVKQSVSSIGTPVKFVASPKNREKIDRLKVIRSNFEVVKKDIESIIKERKEDGRDSLNDPRVFFAQVVSMASGASDRNSYAIRVMQLKTSGGQGHVAGMKRLLELGHEIVGHDLPSIEEFSKFQTEYGIVAGKELKEMLERYESLYNFVNDRISVVFNERKAVELSAENDALKKKVEEYEKRLKEQAGNTGQGANK